MSGIVLSYGSTKYIRLDKQGMLSFHATCRDPASANTQNITRARANCQRSDVLVQETAPSVVLSSDWLAGNIYGNSNVDVDSQERPFL